MEAGNMGGGGVKGREGEVPLGTVRGYNPVAGLPIEVSSKSLRMGYPDGH